MNHQLLKTLKEAGYPQGYSVSSRGNIISDPDFPYPRNIQEKDYPEELKKYKDRMVYEPTLSQLIEACSDDLYSLQHSFKLEGFSHLGDWYVISSLAPAGNGPVFHSDTPEECVASLWIALNKKHVPNNYSNKEDSES